MRAKRERQPDTFWALDDLLTDGQRAKMLDDLSGAWNSDGSMAHTQMILDTVGTAAMWEGKSFDESLKAYWLLYYSWPKKAKRKGHQKNARD